MKKLNKKTLAVLAAVAAKIENSTDVYQLETLKYTLYCERIESYVDSRYPLRWDNLLDSEHYATPALGGFFGIGDACGDDLGAIVLGIAFFPFFLLLPLAFAVTAVADLFHLMGVPIAKVILDARHKSKEQKGEMKREIIEKLIEKINEKIEALKAQEKEEQNEDKTIEQ